jgi:hypothetical protein
MTDEVPRPHAVIFESREPLNKGQAFCADCGLIYDVVSTAALDEVRVVCSCGRSEPLDLGDWD